jgi:hypothetical protein
MAAFCDRLMSDPRNQRALTGMQTANVLEVLGWRPLFSSHWPLDPYRWPVCRLPASLHSKGYRYPEYNSAVTLARLKGLPVVAIGRHTREGGRTVGELVPECWTG